MQQCQEITETEVETVSSLPKLEELINSGVEGKRVLVRTDINVPMSHGKVSDTTRIRRVVPTFQELLKNKAKVIVLSHFGRPTGEFDPDLSLAPISDILSMELGGRPVKFAVDCVGTSAKEAVDGLKNGEILVVENLRFHPGEKENDPEFVSELASLGDAYVNDAFSCSHRAHASIVGLAEKLPSYAGLLLDKEVQALEDILNEPDRPMAAIVGGAKVSTKVDLLETLVTKVDVLIIGGGMANTFLFAEGKNIEKSLCEKDCKDTVLKILAQAKESKCKIVLPTDAVVAMELEQNPECTVVNVDKVPEGGMMLDIGPKTILEAANELAKCHTVVWNGPLGAFEYSPFDVGTITLSRIVATQTTSGELVSVAGGGDILSALQKAGLRRSFSYVSTAGGAFLEWLEGKELPGITALKN